MRDTHARRRTKIKAKNEADNGRPVASMTCHARKRIYTNSCRSIAHHPLRTGCTQLILKAVESVRNNPFPSAPPEGGPALRETHAQFGKPIDAYRKAASPWTSALSQSPRVEIEFRTEKRTGGRFPPIAVEQIWHQGSWREVPGTTSALIGSAKVAVAQHIAAVLHSHFMLLLSEVWYCSKHKEVGSVDLAVGRGVCTHDT